MQQQAQPQALHQNRWEACDNPNSSAGSIGDELKLQARRQQGRDRSAAWRRARRAEGRVHLRLILPVPVYERLVELQQQSGYRSLAEFVEGLIERSSARLEVRSLLMPTMRSKTDNLREANLMVTPQTLLLLDRIKATHGISRSYAVEALLSVMHSLLREDGIV